MRAVRTFLAICMTACIAAGCSSLDEDKPHKTRLEAFSDRFSAGNRRTDSLHRSGSTPDTTVYISGVEFPEGYDWRQDSLYGSTTGRILLLKDSERILSIDAGGRSHASTDPDKHHLVNGHIFTEFSDSRMTYIGKDGKELFSYDGNEYLCGLITDGKDVYTLGQDKDGKGFSLRCNGKVLFSHPDGCISGRMSDRPDYPTGALYTDSGHMYFCYRRALTSGSSSNAWFIVEDCCETQVYTETEALYDIRVKDGEIVKERVSSDNVRTFAYHDGPNSAKITLYNNGNVYIFRELNQIFTVKAEPHYFFSFRNACLFGNDLYMAATPAKEGAHPFVWKNGKETELDINGFVTEIAVSVLP